MSSCLIVSGADGYKAAFALAELDDDLAAKSIILADRRDGSPLAPPEGPLRLIAPTEKRNARWVRNVVVLCVKKAGL